MTDGSRQPGDRLLELVAVMNRLRSPGGCPWDARQTHTSLVPYLVEETYEAIEAIESGDLAHLREELGDVLLQVVFHARIAQEHPHHPFDIDDVADGIADKLRRRHPHVFVDPDNPVVADTAEQVAANWEAIKAQERAQTPGGDGADDPLRGIPAGMPPLARAAHTVARLDRTGRAQTVDATAAGDTAGARLLALVAELVRDGVDPDAALRATLREVHDQS